MPTLSVWFIRASLVALVLGYTVGLLMLSLKAWTRTGLMALLLTPHVDLLLVGWTMQLTMGVAFWILPRFDGGRSRGAAGFAWIALVLLNAGVLLVGGGSLVRSDGARLAGRLMEATAAVAFGLHAWRRIKPASTGTAA